MNYKKYRVCLAGIIVAALICGIFLYVRWGQQNKVPTEGTLVQNDIQTEEIMFAAEEKSGGECV